MDLIAGLSAATKAIELAKAIKDIDAAFNQAELKAKAAELLSDLADVKMALVAAREEGRNQLAEIERLKKSFQTVGNCVERRGYLYEKDANGNPKCKPYCPRCLTIDGIAIKLVAFQGMKTNCPECQREYNVRI